MESLIYEQISILIADDHQLVRNGISRMLEDEIDLQVMAEVASGDDALAFIKKRIDAGLALPDIVLMDARMPGMGGIEATRQINDLKENVKVVAMSSIVSGIIPSQMLRAGAVAFITKTVSIEEMLKAIRLVAEGKHYVTTEAAIQLAMDPFNQDGQAIFDRLSRREMQIAQMLSDGRKVSQIAKYLGLNSKTIYSYRYRVFEKLGVKSDVELTILAVKHGLSDDSNEISELTESEIERFAS